MKWANRSKSFHELYLDHQLKWRRTQSVPFTNKIPNSVLPTRWQLHGSQLHVWPHQLPRGRPCVLARDFSVRIGSTTPELSLAQNAHDTFNEHILNNLCQQITNRGMTTGFRNKSYTVVSVIIVVIRDGWIKLHLEFVKYLQLFFKHFEIHFITFLKHTSPSIFSLVFKPCVF